MNLQKVQILWILVLAVFGCISEAEDQEPEVIPPQEEDTKKL